MGFYHPKKKIQVEIIALNSNLITTTHLRWILKDSSPNVVGKKNYRQLPSKHIVCTYALMVQKNISVLCTGW